MIVKKNWQTVPLRQLVISQKGKKPQWIAEKRFDDSVPYLDIETLEHGETLRYSDQYSTTIATSNDLLIVADGSRSGLIFRGVDGAVGSTILCLTPIKINSAFLFYFLKSKYFFLTSNKTGDSIPHLNTELFFDLQVPFPPISEQLKIVESLESSWLEFEKEFNSHNFESEKSLKKELHFLDKHASVNENDYSLKGFKNSLFSFFFKDNTLFPNARFNSGVKLKEVVDSIDYGTAKPMGTQPIGTPILRIPNLKDFFIDQTNLKYAVLTESEYGKLKLKKDDILLIRSNGSISLLGKSCLVTEKEIGMGFAGYLLRLRVKSEMLNAKYLNYCLHSPEIRSQIESIERSSSGVNNINTKEVLNLEINIPDLKYQVKISEKIEILLGSINKAEVENFNSKNNLENLQNAILDNAFSSIANDHGENVDDQLLAEILSEKGNFEKKLKEFKKVQSIKANEMFMSSKDQTKIIEHIKKFTLKEFGDKKDTLSEIQINKIKEDAILSFRDFDYDDFSSIFLELTQDKINKNDPDPFFTTTKQDGKIVIKVR